MSTTKKGGGGEGGLVDENRNFVYWLLKIAKVDAVCCAVVVINCLL